MYIPQDLGSWQPFFERHSIALQSSSHHTAETLDSKPKQYRLLIKKPKTPTKYIWIKPLRFKTGFLCQSQKYRCFWSPRVMYGPKEAISNVPPRVTLGSLSVEIYMYVCSHS